MVFTRKDKDFHGRSVSFREGSGWYFQVNVYLPIPFWTKHLQRRAGHNKDLMCHKDKSQMTWNSHLDGCERVTRTKPRDMWNSKQWEVKIYYMHKTILNNSSICIFHVFCVRGCLCVCVSECKWCVCVCAGQISKKWCAFKQMLTKKEEPKHCKKIPPKKINISYEKGSIWKGISSSHHRFSGALLVSGTVWLKQLHVKSGKPRQPSWGKNHARYDGWIFSHIGHMNALTPPP